MVIESTHAESVHQTYLTVRRQRATFCDPNIASACLVPKQPQTAASLQELKNLIGPARSSRGRRYPLDGGLGLEKKAVKKLKLDAGEESDETTAGQK